MTVESPPPVAPRTPCRDAQPHEIPAEAQALFDAAAPTRPMLLRLTYAQGGPTRPQSDLGVCPICTATVGINADGSLRAHSVPRPPDVACLGAGAPVFADPDGKAACAGCGVRARVGKKGTLGVHKRPNPVVACDSNDVAPEYRITQPELPPVESVVLRLAWSRDCYAIGCWHDGAFVMGFISTTRDVVEKSTGEHLGTATGLTMVKKTAYTAYVHAQSQARL